MQKTKKSMLASGLAVLVCVAMLIGATFAWFTDSVTNKGNTIQSGNLQVDAYWFKWDPSYNGGQGQFVQKDNPADQKMSGSNWEPGQSDALLVRLDNQGLASKLRLSFDVTAEEHDLTDALWFHVSAWTGPYDSRQSTQPKYCGQPIFSSNSDVISMSGIESWEDEGITLTANPTAGYGAQESSWRGWYLIQYGMYADAGNAYMNGSVNVDLCFEATQAPVETDGFGNSDYDAHAAYAVSAQTADEVTAALKNGKNVSLENDIIEVFTIDNSTTDVTVNLNGKTVYDPNDTNGNGVFEVKNGTLTLCGNGTVNGLGNNNWSMAVWANNNGVVKITDGYYTNVGAGPDDHYDLIYASDNASIYISGGTFKCHTPAWTLNLLDASRKTAKIVVTGGTFYQFDPSNCASEGEGTNFVAEGYKVVQDGDWYTVVPE